MIYQSEKLPSTTFQLIPSRFIDNKSVNHLADSFHKLYQKPFERINIDPDNWKIDYNSQNDLFWEIFLSKDSIKFYVTTLKDIDEYVENQIENTWPKLTIKKSDYDFKHFNPKNTDGVNLKLGQHYFLSLLTDRRTIEPLPSIFEITKSMEEGDYALIQLGLIPINVNEFYEAVNNAYDKYKKGNMPQRKELNAERVIKGTAKLGATVGLEVMKTFAELITEEDIEMEEVKDPDRLNLIREGGLSNSTKKKGKYHGFDMTLRVIANSTNESRRNAILKSLQAAFRTLNDDNELQAKGVKNMDNFLDDIRNRKLPLFKLNKDYISTAELSRFIQMPTWNMQQDFKNIENIATRELRVPKSMRKDGILIGDITHRGNEKKVYWPTNNYDELCLPRVVVGGMGTGKSIGFGSGFATDAIRKGFSTFALDVSDGDMANTIRDSLPKDFPKDHIIDLNLGNVNKPIPLNWNEVTNGVIRSSQVSNLMANQLVNYMNKFSDKSGNRTERYMKAAAKAVYEYDQDATLLEIILIILSEEYREEVIKNIKNPRLKDLWRDFNEMNEGKRMQVAQPILNRFDSLIGNETIANSIFQRNGHNIDFRKWADGDSHPYCVILRIPKSILWEDATDALATYLVAKLWLAILTRIDQPTNERKPCFLIMDEPHQFISGAKVWQRMVVESRKWRLGLIFMFHDWTQLPRDLSKIIKSANPHYTLYSSSKKTFADLKEEIAPFTVEEALKIKTHYAINVIKANNQYHQFLAKMAKPPIDDKKGWRYKYINRENITKMCSEIYGNDIKEVKEDIYKREKCIY